MKKLLLLLISGALAVTASAQERKMNPVSAFAVTGTPGKVFTKQQVLQGLDKTTTANKTTTASSRWYNYAFEYIDTTQNISSAGAYSVVNTSAFMWQDSNGTYTYGGTTPGSAHINLLTVGEVFDPNAPSFNDSNYFVGQTKVTSADAYVVDSVQIFGVYDRSAAKATVVDTLILSFVKGYGGTEATDDIFGGGGITSTHYGSISFLDLHYDSVKNYARNGMAFGTAANNVLAFPLPASEWADTNAYGVWRKTFAIPTALAVSGGGYAGMSISFKSGDAARPTSPTPPSGGDTVEFSSGAVKFNNFQPLISYISDGTNAQWAPFISGDHNTGYFKKQPTWANGWSETYLPQYAFYAASSGNAFYYQYPNINWHITCSTCGTITNTAGVKNVNSIAEVSAYPNPANSELNVPFRLSQSAHVTVSLNNMVGQVVATQDMGTVVSGKAVFNTSSLPAGVYVYSVLANGGRNTGRIVITH